MDAQKKANADAEKVVEQYPDDVQAHARGDHPEQTPSPMQEAQAESDRTNNFHPSENPDQTA